MEEYRGIKYISLSISSTYRGIGKTTLAKMLIRFLRSLGYNVRYSGHNNSHTSLVNSDLMREDDETVLDKSVSIIIIDRL